MPSRAYLLGEGGTCPALPGAAPRVRALLRGSCAAPAAPALSGSGGSRAGSAQTPPPAPPCAGGGRRSGGGRINPWCPAGARPVPARGRAAAPDPQPRRQHPLPCPGLAWLQPKCGSFRTPARPCFSPIPDQPRSRYGRPQNPKLPLADDFSFPPRRAALRF